MDAVNIESLAFAYPEESPIFRDFNLNIGAGERWSIIGPSGCGKTTLLYLLAGLRRPCGGQIRRNGSASNGHKAKTGLVLQDLGLLPWATAAENLSLGLRIYKVEKAAAEKITQDWLADLGLERVSRHYPAELSGGQRQRVAIGRTLALDPEMLLMDEPFASLDALTREDLLIMVMGLWRKLAFTALLVTHNIDEAVFWGSKVLVLKTGANTNPVVIENASSGSADYRDSPDFARRCQALRTLLEKGTEPAAPGAGE